MSRESRSQRIRRAERKAANRAQAEREEALRELEQTLHVEWRERNEADQGDADPDEPA